MDVSFFIASRLRFKGRIAAISIAISFLVMIIAVAVSSGFRHEIRSGLSDITGDVRITPPNLSVLDVSTPIECEPAYLPYVKDLESVEQIMPVAYRAAIVKNAEDIHGILIKGVPGGPEVPDSIALPVSIPRRLAEISGLKVGDRMLTYFVGENVRARQFNVAEIHDALVQADDKLVVYADLADIQRINGWENGMVSSLEVILAPGYESESAIEAASDEIGTIINAYSSDDEEYVIATSSVSAYPHLFDWLNLIDFNVLFILLLMTIVAGFNMISGLLIMLFENISTIGLLKSLGMTDRAIAKVFLTSSAALVFKGMLAGNLAAILFCVIQGTTHLLRLNPENYFVSSVPVNLDFAMILSADMIAFVAIMILLLLPCMFISRIDPAETVRVK